MSSRVLSTGDGSLLEQRWPACGGRTASGYERCALILTGDEEAGESLSPLVTECGLEPVCLGSLGELRTSALDERAALVLCEEVLPDGNFRDALRILAAVVRKVPVIVFSRIADWDSYLQAMKHGAYDCLRYPFRSGELQWILGQIIRGRQTRA